MARCPVASSSAIHFQRDCLDWLHRCCLEYLYHCRYSRQHCYTLPLLLLLYNPSHTKSAAQPHTVTAIHSTQGLYSLLQKGAANHNEIGLSGFNACFLNEQTGESHLRENLSPLSCYLIISANNYKKRRQIKLEEECFA